MKSWCREGLMLRVELDVDVAIAMLSSYDNSVNRAIRAVKPQNTSNRYMYAVTANGASSAAQHSTALIPQLGSSSRTQVGSKQIIHAPRQPLPLAPVPVFLEAPCFLDLSS